jgi:hypothetical protein
VKGKKVKKEEVVKIELETVQSLPKRKSSGTVKGKLKKDLKGLKVETDISDGGLQKMKSVPLRKSNRSVSRDKSNR